MLLYKVLEDGIKFINLWEQNLMDQKILESEFLTKPTADGLRVTMKSTIELAKYLLTAKLVITVSG